MEFLRFGSSIPGSYWGCCAVCIIQNFKVDPDAKASVELVGGDGGNPIPDGEGGMKFVGPTWRDIFKNRIRFGTFSTSDMPNHGFIAILTQSQVSGGVGLKWLQILREEGFEFIRAIDNSVYTGQGLISKPGDIGRISSHPNYIFGLFRNIGAGAVADPHAPPPQWTSLPDPYGGDLSNENMQKVQLEHWKKGKTVFLTEAEAKDKSGKDNCWRAGRRSDKPQEILRFRDMRAKAEALKTAKPDTPKTKSFPSKPSTEVVAEEAAA